MNVRPNIRHVCNLIKRVRDYDPWPESIYHFPLTDCTLDRSLWSDYGASGTWRAAQCSNNDTATNSCYWSMSCL